MICDRLRQTTATIARIMRIYDVCPDLRRLVSSELDGLVARIEALENLPVPAAARAIPEDVVNLSAERARRGARGGPRPRPAPSGGDAA